MYVVIDTSSYINLSAYQYRDGTLLNVLDEAVTLRYSSTVNQEVARHWNNSLPDSLSRSAKIHYPEKYNQDDYEQRLFDSINPSSKDKGEKHNFIVALDLFLIQKQSNLIFLLDDDTALRGCLNEVKGTFPFVKIWNSFDAVLFLYFLQHKKQSLFTLEVAKDALRQLHRQTISSNPQTAQEKAKEWEKKLNSYKTYLDRIYKLNRRYE